MSTGPVRSSGQGFASLSFMKGGASGVSETEVTSRDENKFASESATHLLLTPVESSTKVDVFVHQ